MFIPFHIVYEHIFLSFILLHRILIGIRTYIDAFCRQDLDACLATFAPDGTYSDPATAQPLSGQAIIDHFGGGFAGFPDATARKGAVTGTTDYLARWIWGPPCGRACTGTSGPHQQ